jgi:hypothetical protein
MEILLGSELLRAGHGTQGLRQGIRHSSQRGFATRLFPVIFSAPDREVHDAEVRLAV